jgi:DNA-3-methyladenine glycosylase II
VRPITQDDLLTGVGYLIHQDAALSGVVERYGPPPLWARTPGFPTLVYIILEQQVSLASARATYDRLRSRVNPLTPEAFLKLDDETLKGAGFSRQKTAYARNLARMTLEGSLDIEALASMSDEEVETALTRIKGIGPWTAGVYLLMALGRPDVWPTGDLALAIAVRRVKDLPSRPDPDALEQIGAVYRPWRSVAARLFWWDYLEGRSPG